MQARSLIRMLSRLTPIGFTDTPPYNAIIADVVRLGFLS